MIPMKGRISSLLSVGWRSGDLHEDDEGVYVGAVTKILFRYTDDENTSCRKGDEDTGQE